MKKWIKNNLHIIVPVIIAFVLRFVHFIFVANKDPLFLSPVCDEWFHANQARQISDAYAMNGQIDQAGNELQRVISECKEGERLVNSAKMKLLFLSRMGAGF